MVVRADLIGMVLGRLTLLGFDKVKPNKKSRYWLRSCRCGYKNISVTSSSLVRVNGTEGCGSISHKEKYWKDLAGNIYGRLTDISYDDIRSTNSGIKYWLCSCSCTHGKLVLASNLT